jgi:hypothetical protein
MGFDRQEPDERRQLNRALAAADITIAELWLRYFSICGAVGEYEVQAYIEGVMSLPSVQRDLLAMAAKEITSEMP